MRGISLREIANIRGANGHTQAWRHTSHDQGHQEIMSLADKEVRAMSDNQRRAICRILFLTLCVLPTSAIGYWICHPQTAHGWERAIQAQLGITTSIDSVETPGPYVTVLRGLKFLDLDGETLFKTVTTKIEYGREFNQIVFPDKVHGLTNEGLSFLVRCIDQNVIRKQSTEKHWILVFEKNATIHQAFAAEVLATAKAVEADSAIMSLPLNASLTVSQLRIDIGPTGRRDGTLAEVNFKIVDPEGNTVSEKFVNCQISKTIQSGHFLLLNTNESALPCWLATHSGLDLPSTIGRNATFDGALRFEPASTTANIEVAGVFANVALVTAVSVVSQNTALIQLNQCKFENGELKNWDALLYLDSESSPKPIDEKYLFTFSRKLDIAGALTKTWLDPTPRSANRGSGYH